MSNIDDYDNEPPIVAFEKWHDPWGRDDEETDDGFEEQDMNEDGTMPYKDEKDKLLDKLLQEDKKDSGLVKSLMTPMGPIPIDEYSSPSKNWNFWMGHTNFKITEDMAVKIAKISGVEALDVFTPYRMRIAVGKLFVPRKVMSRITSFLKSQFETIDEQE